MAAGSVHQVVEKLQARLATNPDPEQLWRDLKTLSALPISVAILADTGVGKTVSRLRKLEQVGSLARDLVAQWKKLVPVAGNTEPDERDLEKSDPRKRPRDALPKEGEMERDHQELGRSSRSRSDGSETRQKKHRKPSELERPRQVSHSRERPEERKKCHRVSSVCSSELESYDCDWSPPSSAGPPQMSGDHHRRPAEAHVARQRPGEGHSDASQDRRGLSYERHLGAPQGEGAVSQSKEHKSSYQDERPVGAKGQKFSVSITHQAFPREESSRPLFRDSAKEKPPSSGVKKEKEREGRCVQKFSPPSEVASDHHLKKRKHRDSEKTKSDQNKESLDTLDTGMGPGGPLPKVKEKVSSNLKTQGKVKTSHWDRKSGGSLREVAEADTDDEFQPPSMSFESYLNYDQPPKKKKKIVKTSVTALKEKGLKKNDSKSTSENLDSVQELPKVNESKSEKLQLSGADCAKLKKVPTDAFPVLPDLPLLSVRASCCPLPAFEWMPSVQPKPKALSSPQEEEEAGFTGRRVNSKMQVFSGSKCAYLPRMMTLRQQCIQVLKNKIDSIFEVGGVPYSVLEPILKSCTPDQLYRIEKYNHVLVEETDKLWKIHCRQNFQKERPEEHESWREMYLRLQDAREQRLRELAVNIKSAHADMPKGRQAKMILFNSVAKTPSDVPRRQEKFEAGGAAVREKAMMKPVPYPTRSSPAPSSCASSNSGNLIPEKPASDCPGTSSAHLVQVVSNRKPAKKIAPLMAKTIKDFKKRFSRR
ncbi:elongin-A2 [Diceros bicornis minor]|uniref:elongin-A2 n=1 Tax=Diceros bicornis minor TaxID=77932 RepID=UPI0026EEE46B|nr:elongin-A2 [Diceros bicornis minor]